MELQYTKVQTLQPVLATQINELKKALSLYQQEGFLGAILFGSCALGNATYRSDIDIFLIFAIEKLDFSFVSSIRENVDGFFEKINKREMLEQPLPVEFQVVRETVFLTSESEIKKNLKSGIILVDNSGRLGRQIREINE